MPDRACAHSSHNDAAAIDALAHMVVHGAVLSAQLHVADTAQIEDQDPWAGYTRYVALRALYTTERSLIEFTLRWPVRAHWCENHHKSFDLICKVCGLPTEVADDVCPGCFLSKERAKFPFGHSGEDFNILREHLEHRRVNTNKQISHLSWRAVDEPRSWTYAKNEYIIDGLALFADALEAEGSPHAHVLIAALFRARNVWGKVAGSQESKKPKPTTA